MEYTWRWFGPDDPVSLADIRQAGATGVVTALHHLGNGTVWPRSEIDARRALIEASGLRWSVVESIPVPEPIKLGAADWRAYAQNWTETALNLAASGVTTICYNFMPVLDWTRTQLRHKLPDGAECLRFDLIDLAAFDLCILKRTGASASYPAALCAAAVRRADQMDDAARAVLSDTVLAGLPGAEESYTLEGFRDQLARYNGIGPDRLRANLAAFLHYVLPQLGAAGVRLAIHPDDPPRTILGLPRVVSSATDLQAILEMQDCPANGLTFCVGSLGVRGDNDLPAMLRRFGARVHFLHLRNTRRDVLMPETAGAGSESFEEAAHLSGDADMVAIIRCVLDVEAARGVRLPFRPDHGHALQADLRGPYRPGYPAIGRLRGMAEIRGIETALRAIRGGCGYLFHPG